MERKKVGEIFHFFGKISVAAIRLTDDSLAIGDTVQIQGPTTNLEQTVDTLQIEHANVSRADRGQEVGMKVRERVREKDFVYKIVKPEAAAAPSPAAPVKRAPVKRARAKRAPVKRVRAKRRAKRAPVRKASRATRSKARRRSRGSRPRSK